MFCCRKVLLENAAASAKAAASAAVLTDAAAKERKIRADVAYVEAVKQSKADKAAAKAAVRAAQGGRGGCFGGGGQAREQPATGAPRTATVDLDAFSPKLGMTLSKTLRVASVTKGGQVRKGAVPWHDGTRAKLTTLTALSLVFDRVCR